MTVEILFLTSLSLTLLLVALVLIYMRSITRRILLSLCHEEIGADFWLRSINVLALSGALIVTLVATSIAPTVDPIPHLRTVLGWSLGSVFITVAIIASTIWRSVEPVSSARSS